MKKHIQLLCCFLLAFVLAKPVKAQGWEMFVADSSIANSSSRLWAVMGANDGVRIATNGEVLTGNNILTKFINFDANGEFIEKQEVSGITYYSLYQSDSQGATYWRDGYSVRKINANNQIEWTLNAPNASPMWGFPGPNNSTYIQYQLDSNVVAIDVINKDGLLEHHFDIVRPFTVQFLPTADYGLIYRTASYGFLGEEWAKLDSQGNVVWTKFTGSSFDFLLGATDGSTYQLGYFFYGDIEKYNAAGDIEWQKNLRYYFFDNTDNHFKYSFIELSDGNVAMLSSGSDTTTGEPIIQITKINAATGDIIWRKMQHSTLNGINGYIGFFELSDGGILTAWQTNFNFITNTPQVFIMRTDKNGNTHTNQINGNLYKDQNSDCQYQNTETAMSNVSVLAKSATRTYSTTTDNLGNYSMSVGSGNYEITYGQLGTYWGFCDAPNVSLAAANDTASLNNGAFARVNCPELVVSIGSNVFRRCFDNNYLQINYQNIGTTTADDAYLDLLLDPKLEFLSASPISATQNGQVFRFDLGDINAGESGQISVNFKVDCDAELNEILCANAHIYPDTTCLPAAPRHAENQFCLPVVALFDPNDKMAFLDGKPEFSKILPQADLEYLIRFQNTGNDTAFNIVVVDTLSTFLEATSVLPGASSHAYTFELRDGHILRFSFKNILLPDSTTNEAASHGFVKFRVLQNPNNVIGDEIKNSAAIFFDYNEAVITNETNLQISIPDHTTELQNEAAVQISPNPASEKVQISLKNVKSDNISWRMFNATGQLVAEGKSQTPVFDIPRNGQVSGVYYCQFLLRGGERLFGKIIFN